MRKFWLFALTIGMQTALAGAATKPHVTLWRLDCGHLGQSMNPTSCYLIRHGNTYMLWDAGLNPELAHKGVQKDGPRTFMLDESLPEQLKRLRLNPEDVSIVALSHVHYDHVEGAVSFPRATLFIGRADYDTLINKPSVLTSHPWDITRGLAPWISGGSRKDLVDGDRDIFGDGSVLMLDAPGHTPGHHCLEVKLRHRRTIILAGDLWHNTHEFENGIAPKNIIDAQQTAASVQRIKSLAVATHAVVIISHEEGDVGKLPAFPRSAD